ncbi:MAG TPA: NUDIX domain-containing protein [Candidatus Saccharimonadales bacterium]|nr:NUDIX domain-containing protein [Candidatus Saccharimonadales bacterium]
MKVSGDMDKIEEYGTPNAEATDVEGVVIIGYDPAIDKWLALEWEQHGMIWLVGGGKEAAESYEEAALRELREETGYTAFEDQIQLGGPIISHYYNDKKAVYRRSYSFAFLFLLDSATQGKQQLEAHEQFKVKWLGYEPLRSALEQTGGGVEHWLAVLARAHDYLEQNSLIRLD